VARKNFCTKKFPNFTLGTGLTWSKSGTVGKLDQSSSLSADVKVPIESGDVGENCMVDVNC